MTRIIHADRVPPLLAEGPFGHLDVRWLVGPDNGASLVAFGQSTYPPGSTHERHFHPNAEEVVMVLRGRGEHAVGDETLAMGPGDVCFVPRGVRHQMRAASDEELVIIWVFGGAATLEAAGYVAA